MQQAAEECKRKIQEAEEKEVAREAERMMEKGLWEAEMWAKEKKLRQEREAWEREKHAWEEARVVVV